MKINLPKELNLVGVGITILVLVLLTFIIDIEELKTWVINAGMWAPLAFILLKISTIVVAPISGGPLYPIAGLLFGFWPGLLYVGIGDFLGYTIAFSLSRFFGKALVQKMIAQKEEGLFAQIIERVSSPRGFFTTALTFLPVPELLSYGAGLTKLRYIVFITILWPLWTSVSVIFVFIGSYFDFGKNSLIASIGLSGFAVVFLAIGSLLFMRDLKKSPPQIPTLPQ